MGIEGNLKQISPYLLEKLIKYPDFITVFDYAIWLPESNYWQNYQNMDVPPDALDMFGEIANAAIEVLQDLEKNKPEDYERIKADIPLILEEGKTAGLELDKAWHIVSFLLTGYQQMGILPFLISDNSEDNLPSVNAVQCGTETECEATYGFYRYLTPDEVKQVSKALSNLSEANIKKRFERGFRKKLDIYSIGRTENEFNFVLNYCARVVNYYKDAAQKGNGMLIWLS
ncbi:DUF1877 family protein [Aerosakkonema funiforme]|uniref:DUF1877 family protein n=2 Tax=Oscillatoriophycideae TaxID=1301283 RepID=A0A926VA76_9CYAN|nr:DUF1877 family protein [Aerosakkonema funiforme]MBD2179643.1 DUF1877 family protein [Aerosakkonema funiforme FACHB-1375]